MEGTPPSITPLHWIHYHVIVPFQHQLIRNNYTCALWTLPWIPISHNSLLVLKSPTLNLFSVPLLFSFVWSQLRVVTGSQSKVYNQMTSIGQWTMALTCGNFIQVDNWGTRNVVDACKLNQVKKIVLVSSILVNGAAIGQLLNPVYIILNIFGLTLVAKLQAENYIRKSGIDYTIIRPGGLKNDPPSGNIFLSREVC